MCSQSSIVSTIATFDKVVVELGMGDGQLLHDIIKYGNSPKTCYVGIEIESKQIQKARDKLKKMRGKNIYLINDSFERILLYFADNCVDEFIFVLPPPNYIDKSMESQWILLYQNIYNKLKERGTLIIITELIDDLLGPVSDNEFRLWKEWLRSSFVSVGFRVKGIFNYSPSYYSSYFLNQFKGDQLRIKLITFILTKSESKS